MVERASGADEEVDRADGRQPGALELIELECGQVGTQRLTDGAVRNLVVGLAGAMQEVASEVRARALDRRLPFGHRATEGAEREQRDPRSRKVAVGWRGGWQLRRRLRAAVALAVAHDQLLLHMEDVPPLVARQVLFEVAEFPTQHVAGERRQRRDERLPLAEPRAPLRTREAALESGQVARDQRGRAAERHL